MSNKPEGFISNIFNNSVISGSLQDVREQMTYNLTKAYPSVNSSNAGLIHSEENVRWLTKQFVRKPFIIQYDDNTMDEFAYTGAELYAGIANGGMVNIDGYIINSASDMTALSFDNTKDTKLGTNGSGYIGHYQLQLASQEFLQGLEDSDLKDYIDIGDLEINNPDTTATVCLSIYFNNLKETYPSANLTLANCWEYLRRSLCNINKKETRDESIEYVYRIHNVNVPLDFNISETASINNTSYSTTSIYIGKTDVTYTDDIKDYIVEHMDYTNIATDYSDYVDNVVITTDSSTGVVSSIKVTYKIYYGLLKDKIRSTTDSSDNYLIPAIYIKDILGFTYIFTTGMHVTTHSYPSTMNTNINLLQDTITPPTSDVDGHNILRGISNIYDASDLYRTVTTDDELNGLDIAIENASSNPDCYHYTLNQFVTRDDSSTSTSYNNPKTLSDILSNNFTNVTATSIINTYTTYNNVSMSTDILNKGGHLYNLCDNYYCLPLSSDICRLFCLPSYDNNYVPVGFMTGSGALMFSNYERTFDQSQAEAHPEWSYQTTYINSYDNSTVYQQVYVEGYISFFRRVCAILYGIDITSSTPYGNISNLNEYDSWGWRNIYKAIQYQEIQPQVPGSWQGADVTIVEQFFGVAISSITFDVMYNKLLAPYINFYLQLAESCLIQDTLTSTNNNFKAVAGYTVIKNSVTDPSIIIEDTSDKITLQLTHQYSDGVQTYDSTKEITYELNTQTDYQRLNNYLNDINGTQLTKGLTPRDKVSINGLTTAVQKVGLCEDYIDYIKGCARINWTDRYAHDNSYVQTSYKITTLGTIDNEYKFSTTGVIYDIFATYTKIDSTNQEVVADIVPDYIQNVRISTANLLPDTVMAYKAYKWYGDTSTLDPTGRTTPLDYVLYNLSYKTRRTIDYDGGQEVGISGYYFQGMSQGWSLGFPTLFRLYKDGQNYLEGRKRGTEYHAGLYIDYKLPRDIQDNEFWFVTTWLSAIRTVTTFDIENSGLSDTLGTRYVNYPAITDGTKTYLHLRNHTIFSKDVIYSEDDEGNYQSFDEYVENLIVNNQQDYPNLSYVDSEYNETTDTFGCVVNTHEGVIDNVERLQEYVHDLSWDIEHSIGHETTYEVTLSNNKYFDLTQSYNSYSGIQTLTIVGCEELPTTNKNRFTINTTQEKSDNTIIRSTIKVKFQNSVTTPFTILLNTNLNGSIPVAWDSNYPVTVVNTESGPQYKIQVWDLASNQSDSVCFVELEIHLNSQGTSGIGHCNVSVVASNSTLTLMDMNYLWKEFYTLDRLSWTDVSNATKRGLAPKLWQVGNTKTFDITYGGHTYAIQAMIIGINEEPSVDAINTITWITNIYANPATDVTSVPLFNPELYTNLSWGPVHSNYNNGRLGYDAVSGQSPNHGYDLFVVDWLNNNNPQGSEIGVLGYCDSAFVDTIIPANKTTGLVYTYSDGTSGALLCASSAESYEDSTYVDLYRADVHTRLPFWLPSLSELGLLFTTDDSIEQTLNSNNIVTREAPYYIQDGTVSYFVNEKASGSVVNPCEYSYFKLPKSQQRIYSPTMLCRSYYVTNLDVTTLTPPTTVADYTYTAGDYDNVDRIMYLVGSTQSSVYGDGRYFQITHSTAAITTDFCFITG